MNLAKLMNCRLCQSIWLSSIVVSALTLFMNPLLVLTFPVVWYALYSNLPDVSAPPASKTKAQEIAERYQVNEEHSLSHTIERANERFDWEMKENDYFSLRRLIRKEATIPTEGNCHLIRYKNQWLKVAYNTRTERILTVLRLKAKDKQRIKHSLYQEKV